MRNIKDYLAEIESRAMKAGYKIEKDIVLPGGLKAHLVLLKKQFVWQALSRATEVVVVVEREKADISDVHSVEDAGRAYFRKTVRSFLPVGLYHALNIIPCIVAKTVSKDAIKYVSSSPRNHWAAGELPVLYDLGTGEVYYFRGYHYYNFAFIQEMQKSAETVLVGDSPEAEVQVGNFDAEKYDKRTFNNSEYWNMAPVIIGVLVGFGIAYWHGHMSLFIGGILGGTALLSVLVFRSLSKIRKKHIGCAIQTGAMVCLVLYFGDLAVTSKGGFLISCLKLIGIVYSALFVFFHIVSYYHRRRLR